MKRTVSKVVFTGTLAMALFGVSAFAEPASSAPNKLIIQNIGPNGVAEGWNAGEQKDGKATIKFAPSDKNNVFATVNFKIADSENDSGLWVESPSIPLKAGSEFDISFKWQGNGLYDSKKDGNRVNCCGKFDLLLLGGTPERVVDMITAYYFESSEEFKSVINTVKVPDGVSYCRIKFFIARSGVSIGQESTFVVGDLKLIEK